MPPTKPVFELPPAPDTPNYPRRLNLYLERQLRRLNTAVAQFPDAATTTSTVTNVDNITNNTNDYFTSLITSTINQSISIQQTIQQITQQTIQQITRVSGGGLSVNVTTPTISSNYLPAPLTVLSHGLGRIPVFVFITSQDMSIYANVPLPSWSPNEKATWTPSTISLHINNLVQATSPDPLNPDYPINLLVL